VFLKINNYLKILCFFNLVSCSFIGKNNLILAAELPNQISLNEENSQKQILIKTPLENISQPKYFGDENFGDENSPIFLTQTTSTPPKDDHIATFIIGLNAGKRNIRDGVSVRGEVKDKDAINFDNWLISYDDVLQTLKFTSKSISDHEVELRSPFKVIHFDTNKLHNDPESFTLDVDILNILKNLTPFVYENRQEFTEVLSKYLGKELCVVHGEIICQYSDLGRRSFYNKFGWLFNYEQDIDTYIEIFTQIHSVQKQLKTQGLHSESLKEWLKTISIDSLTPRGQKFHEKIIAYLTFETHQIPVGQILLGTSDIVESLFGKYKFFAARRPLKDIGASILLIPLFTLKITTSSVKQAMEFIRFIDVISWTESIFGSSMLSQRRNLKSANISDTEPA
jgi:hypothetical protein